MDDRQERAFEAIVQAVLGILKSEGYDAAQLRAVAKRAHVSLTTIYKFFPTRDDLIVTALSRWMAENCYARLVDCPPDVSFYEAQMWFFRRFFEPWERNPRMLEAYHHAVLGPGGERLDMQGMTAVEPVGRTLLKDVDSTYAKDVELILINMIRGLIQRVALGDLPVSEILPVVERTLFRLTTNNEATLAVAGRHRGRRIKRRGARSGAQR